MPGGWTTYIGPREPNTVVGDLRAMRVPGPGTGVPREVLCLLPPGAETSGR